MHKIPRALYQTADQIEERLKARETEAATLPPGEPRQNVLKEVAQLRVYASAKRWIESPGLQPVNRRSRI